MRELLFADADGQESQRPYGETLGISHIAQTRDCWMHTAMGRTATQGSSGLPVRKGGKPWLIASQLHEAYWSARISYLIAEEIETANTILFEGDGCSVWYS